MDEFSLFGCPEQPQAMSPCDYYPRETMRHPKFWLQVAVGVSGVPFVLSGSWLMIPGFILIIFSLATPKEIRGVWKGDCPCCSSTLILVPEHPSKTCFQCGKTIWRSGRTLFH